MSENGLTETAKKIREILKVNFPKTKFSVRSKSYSGGCSIQAEWIDGPTEEQVSQILKCFEELRFNGSGRFIILLCKENADGGKRKVFQRLR